MSETAPTPAETSADQETDTQMPEVISDHATPAAFAGTDSAAAADHETTMTTSIEQTASLGGHANGPPDSVIPPGPAQFGDANIGTAPLPEAMAVQPDTMLASAPFPGSAASSSQTTAHTRLVPSPGRGGTPQAAANAPVATTAKPESNVPLIIPPANSHGSPTRVYLNSKVTPTLLEGMKYIASAEPERPLEWLGRFLLKRSEETERG